MSKKYVIVTIVLLLILLGASFWYWQSKKVEQPAETANEGVIPSTSTNPLNNKPNINPVDQTNPFKNIKTNPFE